MTAQVIDQVTGEVLDTITPGEARHLTAQAHAEFASATNHFAKAWALIEQAVRGGGHIALGYRSPGDYLRAEFDGVLAGLDVADRRVAVRSMTNLGLSTRAIAPVVGSSFKTVARDAAVSLDTPQSPVGGGDAGLTSEEVEHAVPLSAADVPEPRPPVVVGIDGKRYSRPDHQRPRAEQQAHNEADVINAFSALVRSTFTPANVGELSSAAKAHLVRLLKDAIQTIEGVQA